MAKKKEEKAIVKTSTVYIGRPFPGLPQYTVFKNGLLPDYVRGMIEKKEAIARLIVPVTELPEAKRNIKIKGHILNYYAEQLNKKED